MQVEKQETIHKTIKETFLKRKIETSGEYNILILFVDFNHTILFSSEFLKHTVMGFQE